MFDPANQDPNDELMVELLMGWDGDPCECDQCQCHRSRDRVDASTCAACSVGQHSGNAERPSTDYAELKQPLENRERDGMG